MAALQIPLDEVVHFDVITSNSSGSATDADSTPTFAVYEESTDTDIGVGGSFTKRTALTGNYRASFTASAANGFEVGKWYTVIGSATVGSVAGKCVCMNFRVTAAEAVAGVPSVDVTHLSGDSDAAINLEAACDGSGYNLGGGSIVAVLGNVAHGGNSASFNFGAGGAISNASGTALTLASTGGNGNGIQVSSHGTGSGVYVYGSTIGLRVVGNLGDGIDVLSNNGHGIDVTGATADINADITGTLTTVTTVTNTVGANVTSISGDSVAADNLEAAYDGTGYAGGTIRQKVDLDTIKTQSITCAAGVTIPATLASTTNITSATVDVTKWNGSAVAAPAVAGVPKVDLTHINGTAASGSATIDANMVSISGDTTAADNLEAAYDGTGYAGGTIRQKVDLDTIKTQTVTCAAGVTVPATLASTTNITSATGIDVTKWNGSTVATPSVAGVPEVDITHVSGSAASPAGTVSATVSDKTGFKLASDGLDSIATTAPTGAATNFREMVVQTWRRFFKKATKTDSQLITYADNGTTPITTQTVQDDGSTETQGAA